MSCYVDSLFFCNCDCCSDSCFKAKKRPRSDYSVSIGGLSVREYERQQEVDSAAVMVNMQRVLSASPDIIPEMVPVLMSRIQDGLNLFPFEGELLSLEQKRELGMNTRLSVPSDVLLFYTPSGLKSWHRRHIFEVYGNCANMIRRQRSLEMLERAGCKHIKVAGCETYKGKLFLLSSPPSLPCDKCSKKICSCGFVYGD